MPSGVEIPPDKLAEGSSHVSMAGFIQLLNKDTGCKMFSDSPKGSLIVQPDAAHIQFS
jgi:hypothetical protein